MGTCSGKLVRTVQGVDQNQRYDSEYGRDEISNQGLRMQGSIMEEAKREQDTITRQRTVQGDNSNSRIADILRRIKNEPIENINPRQSSKIFFDKLHAYLHCREQMDNRYIEIDELQELALFDLTDDSEELQLDGGDYKTEYLQQSITGQTVENITELYRAAQRARPIFETTIKANLEKVLKELGPESIPDEPVFVLAPLKGKERAVEKAYDDYSKRVPGPAIAYLYDIVRGCITFASMNQLVRFLVMLKDEPSVHIVKVKNRFRTPTLTGYRDITVVFQLEVDGSFKHVCEIQVHHKGIRMLDMSLNTHVHYEYFRKYYAGATGSLEDRLEDLKLIGVGLDPSIMADLLSGCTDVERLKRLGILFDDYLGEPELALKVCARLLELESAESIGSDRSQRILYTRIAKVFHSQGRLNDAMCFLNVALTLSPEQTDWLAECYSAIGRVARDQMKLEYANNMFGKALMINRELHGEQSTTVATGYIDCGHVAMLSGKLDIANGYFQKALQTYIRVYGDDSPHTAILFMDLGRVAFDRGKLEHAKKLFEKALAINTQVSGAENQKVAVAYTELGRFARYTGQLEYAKEMFEKALAIDIQVYGVDNPAVAASYSEIGRVAKDRFQLDYAREMFEKALSINIQVYGANHPNVAISFNDIGRVAKEQNQLEYAKTMFGKALAINGYMYGYNHKDVAVCYTELGRVFQKQWKLEAAKNMFEKALEIDIKVYGKDNPAVAVSYSDLGRVSFAKGDLGDALTMFQIALPLMLKFTERRTKMWRRI